jgi:hypothetical protein
MQMRKNSKTGAEQVIEIAEMRSAYTELEGLWQSLIALNARLLKERSASLMAS